MNLFNNYKDFNENVGAFILTFSAVEFEIGTLASSIKTGINSNSLDPDILGMKLHKKLEIIRNKINGNKDLSKKWERLEGNLSSCNDFRRFISHGIENNHIPNPHLTGIIRAKRDGVLGFRFNKITLEDIKNQFDKISEIQSGINGLGVLTSEIKKFIK